VGSNGDDEESLSLVRRQGIGSSKDSPPEVIPEGGQVSCNGSEAEGEVGPHVLQEDVAGSNHANGCGDVWPEVSLVIGALSFAGQAEGLARISRSDHVGSPEPVPVFELGQVAQVRYARVIVRHHQRCVLVVFTIGSEIPVNRKL
jgi:hypothetical protein